MIIPYSHGYEIRLSQKGIYCTQTHTIPPNFPFVYEAHDHMILSDSAYILWLCLGGRFLSTCNESANLRTLTDVCTVSPVLQRFSEILALMISNVNH